MGSPWSHPMKHYWSNQNFWVRFINYAFNTKGSSPSKTTGPTSMAGPPGHFKARLSTRYTTGPTSMAVYATRRFYPGLYHRIPSKQDYLAHFNGCVVNHIFFCHVSWTPPHWFVTWYALCSPQLILPLKSHTLRCLVLCKP